ncbi:MAG: ArsA family ATPase [Acidobacteriota bacterium]|nr:ArsA family ATPase [Acidobacteriota bacterium]
MAPPTRLGALTSRRVPLLLSDVVSAAGSSHPDRSPLLRLLLTRPLLFIGGKGGVGKTTTAAALALTSADTGRRTLLVSTDPAHSLGDLFDRAIGSRETSLTPSLWAIEVDPDEQADDHLATVKARMKRLVHPKAYDEIDRQLDLALLAPGTTEAAMLERVSEVMALAGDRYDQVIFDTAPTGHTVRLLSLPEIMAAWTEGLLGHRKRSERLSSALRHLGGGRMQGDDLSMLDAAVDHDLGSRDAQLSTLLQNRRRKFVRAREQLLDREQCAFLLVLNPDRLSVLETIKARDTLARFSVPVSALVVNQVLPTNADGTFLEARRRQEAKHLGWIDNEFSSVPRVRVPLLPGDVHDLDTLRRLGSWIASDGQDSD